MELELPDEIKALAKGLTAKQKAFADNFVKNGNATQSAIDAGYSKKTARSVASQNLTKLNIKKYVDARLKFIDDHSIADSKEILSFLTLVMRGEVKEETVVPEGFAVEHDATLRDRIKASELLGKRHMLWTDKIDANISGSLEISNLKNLSTEELRNLANDVDNKKYNVNGDFNS